MPSAGLHWVSSPLNGSGCSAQATGTVETPAHTGMDCGVGTTVKGPQQQLSDFTEAIGPPHGYVPPADELPQGSAPPCPVSLLVDHLQAVTPHKAQVTSLWPLEALLG